MKNIDNDKPGLVIAQCRLCGTKVRKDDKISISNAFIANLQNLDKPMIELPMITCLGCGFKYFAPNELRQIKENLKRASNDIILPQGKPVRLN